MSAFALLTSEQECQTVLQCTPHILAEDGTAIVQSTNVCQTEITIDSSDTDVNLQSVLGYLPSEKIAEDAVRQIKPGRKIKIKFILPKKSILTLPLHETEQAASNSETSPLPEVISDDDISDHSKTSLADNCPQKCKEEDIAKTIPILKKTVGRTIPTESIECQTNLFVYPHFLNGDEKGTVTVETSMQTAFTFTPQSSLSNILPKLKSYLHHDGRVIDCGDGFKRGNVIDFIRELLGDIVNMHEHLFDANCIPPELPSNLALDVPKSTYTNTETNSSSTATNTVQSLAHMSAATSPSISVQNINESKSPSGVSIHHKHLSESIARPACDCCNYSPCCSDLDINILIDRQPFDKCCSTNAEDLQVAVYSPQQPDYSVIKELLDETINKITKTVPNMEKQLIPVGNTDYSQQFDSSSISYPPSLQIVPYEHSSMLEEIVKEKMKNMDPFKFCSEVGTQCDCIKEEENMRKWAPIIETTPRKKLLALPSSSTEPDSGNYLALPSNFVDPDLRLELALRSQYFESILGNELALPSPSKNPNKIHVCRCPKKKPTVGCSCFENKDTASKECVTISTTLKPLGIYNPSLTIEDKAIQKQSLKATEYNIQEEEGPKMLGTLAQLDITNMSQNTSILEMYNSPEINSRYQSVLVSIEPGVEFPVKPSKTVTIIEQAVSQYHIPLKRTQENRHLLYSSSQNSSCLESYMEELCFDLIDDTDEETDDDYTTATSSPTSAKNPDEANENNPERKASREEMMKLLVDLKIIDGDLTKQKQKKPELSNKSSSVGNKCIRSITTSIVSTKTICMDPERKKNFLNLYKMSDTCSSMSCGRSLESGLTPQSSQIITLITQGLRNNYPSAPALYFSKDASAPLSIMSKKAILNSQQSTVTNNVQFSLLKDDDTNSPKIYSKCCPSCSEHIIATKCLDCVKTKNNATEKICAATGLPKPPLKVSAARENPKPPSKTVSLNCNGRNKTPSAQERVMSAVKICESQLQPLRDAFTDLKQKLKQLNIPEVNCIFETDEIDLLKSQSSKKFRIRVATNPDPSKCGFHTTSTKIKFVSPAGPSSSHPNINVCRSRVSSRQSCRSVRSAKYSPPNNYPFATQRCPSAPQDWKRYYSRLLHYDEDAPCLRRPTQDNFSTRGMVQNKGFQTSNSNNSCSLNSAFMEDNFECSSNDFSHVSSEEFQECPYRNNNYYPGNYMNDGQRYN